MKEWGKNPLFAIVDVVFRRRNMKQIEKTFANITQAVIEEMGYELADVELAEELDGLVLTFYIYKPEGITLEDCEKVSRIIDPLIEEADSLEDTYILSVSSLGLDRPFKNKRDFERAINTEIDVHLYAPIQKKKQWIGFLREVTDDAIILEIDGSMMELLQKQVAKATPMIRF